MTHKKLFWFFRIALVLAFGSGVYAHSQPSISSFSPVFGAPGDMVTINGSGFYPGTVVVRFNGVVSSYAAATTYSIVQAQVPSGASTGPITVEVNGSAVDSANDFTVIGQGPYITSFSPTNGSAGTTVIIRGVHFTDAYGADFDGKPGTSMFVQGDTSIQVNAPSGVTTGPIRVRGPLGTNTSPTLFYVPPVLSSWDPAFGRTGTNVLIKGLNLLGTKSVTFGGTNAAFTVLSNQALIAIVPPLARTGKVRVNNPAGSYTTVSDFVIRPTIYGFTPKAGVAGSSIVITGANFNVGTPVVRFNGVSASYSGLGFSSVTAVVPATATTGPISITTTDGSHTNISLFYVLPKITSFTPTNSPPGSRVRITGTSFTGTTNVSFGGVPAVDFAITNSTILGATVPEGVATGPVQVSTPGGTAISPGLFYGPPAIWSFSPTHGLPGTNVTVYGTNLLGATALKFNGLNGTSLVATNNGFLTVKVPAGASAGVVSVVTPAGTSFSTAPFSLDYVDLSVGISVSPEYVFTGSNFTYTISVTNAGPADAPGVQLTNRFLAGVQLLSAEVSQGTVRTNPAPLLASFGTIPQNGVAELELQVRYSGSGPIQDLAGATSSYLELTPANNSASNLTMVLPPPTLSIARITNQVRVAWPLMLSNFTLQYRTGMYSTNIWLNSTKAKTNTDTENVLVETNSGGSRFYRLKSP